MATMATTSLTPPKKHTLFLFTPNSGSPTYLRHLQQSNLKRKWLGEALKFVNMEDPSTWPWSNAALIEGDLIQRNAKNITSGDSVELPSACRNAQTWSFLLEEEEIYPGLVTTAPVGPRPGWPSSNRENRYCVLHFVSFRLEEGEKRYRDHISATTTSVKCAEIDMRFHFTGRILSTEEYFGQGSKRPAKKSTKFPSDPEAKTKEGRHKSSDDPDKPDEDVSRLFVLMSFASSEGYEKYLGWPERESLKDQGITEGKIECSQLDLPPKSEPISVGSWEYGNPHEPYGQDWFG